MVQDRDLGAAPPLSPLGYGGFDVALGLARSQGVRQGAGRASHRWQNVCPAIDALRNIRVVRVPPPATEPGRSDGG